MDPAERERRILETVQRIPRGSVASYSQVATFAGFPGGARQVGRALRGLPDGDTLPWHRVIRASGQIAFPKGSENWLEQVRRLREESVEVNNGRVDLRQWQWRPDLDELIWGQLLEGEGD